MRMKFSMNYPRCDAKHISDCWHYCLAIYATASHHRVFAYVRLTVKRNTHCDYLRFYVTSGSILFYLRSNCKVDNQAFTPRFVAIPEE